MHTQAIRKSLAVILGVWVAAVVGTVFAAGPESRPKVTRAVAVLHATQNSEVSGTVSFTQVSDGVQISATIHGMKPGKHGFHIHEWGDCSAPDATSAGGHYNPGNNPHAGPEQKQRHMGDMGNLEADSSGRADYDRLDSHLTLMGPNSIIGRAVVVHAGEDDLTSQPTGEAGGRLACGVIGIARP